MLDYSSALQIKSTLLPPSSRALASVHYQLATVLEFTPDRRPDALSHVESALSSFRALRTELQSSDVKDKEAEIRDVHGLIGDLEVKIEELKAAPEPKDVVIEGIKHLLGQSGGEGSNGTARIDGKEDGPVRDLTGMVKKKVPKKVEGKGKGVEGVNGVNGEKRSVENGDEPAAKKARVE